MRMDIKNIVELESRLVEHFNIARVRTRDTTRGVKTDHVIRLQYFNQFY